MLDKTIIPQTAHNGQHLNRNGKPASIEARAFVVAFIPDSKQQNTARLWAAKLSEARAVLTEMSSACHRWQATGEINPAELASLMDKLDCHSLDTLVDELVSLATVANCTPELCGVTK